MIWLTTVVRSAFVEVGVAFACRLVRGSRVLVILPVSEPKSLQHLGYFKLLHVLSILIGPPFGVVKGCSFRV